MGVDITSVHFEPIDPFVNPISSRIAPADLDTNLASAHTVPESESASVADQLGNDLLKALGEDTEPGNSDTEDIDTDLIGMDGNELEQILQEFEDDE